MKKIILLINEACFLVQIILALTTDAGLTWGQCFDVKKRQLADYKYF